MALRENPYIPLYVQDYLTDEKLSCCSLSTQGVYIRIMCCLHKSETYGGILFKQIPKQNFSSEQYFSFILSKQTGVEMDEMQNAIEELLFYKVLKIEQRDGVDFLYQKRMVRDFEISQLRKTAGKKGGKKSILSKQNNKQTHKQNPEYENEYEYNIENEYKDKEKGVTGEKTKADEVEVLDELDFENVWALYGKKGNKKTSKSRWNKLPLKSKRRAIIHIPEYVKATPDIQYRKNLETYINQEVWNDEILENEKRTITIDENGRAMGFENSGNRENTFRTDAERRRYEREMLNKVSEAILQQPKT